MKVHETGEHAKNQRTKHDHDLEMPDAGEYSQKWSETKIIMNTILRNMTAPTWNITRANRTRTGDQAHESMCVMIDFPSDAETVDVQVRAAASGFVPHEAQAPVRRDHAVWSVVLAGGEGERLRPLMERWWGAHRPKQYCTFVGSRSMLQHTLDRAESLSGAERLLVVVASHHEPRIWDQLDDHHTEAIVAQPRNRDTAAGIFLPLTYIGVKDPDATVVILPSDHFVYPQEQFVEAVRRAALAAQRLPDKLILLGAQPDHPETEYGWIQPGDAVAQIDGHEVRKVVGFQEKPDANAAQRLLKAGALWNTFVIAAQWQILWQLGWQCFPVLMERFEEFTAHIGTNKEQHVLESIYDQLPSLNFSSGLLQRVPEASVIMELSGVIWSDWGNEMRIVEALKQIGKRPLFPTIPSSGVLR